MALDALKNFAQTTVSTGYNSAATSIVLSAGGGLLFPSVPFNAVWWNSTDYTNPAFDPSVEIVRVTVISTDTLTITRAQESTSASNKNAAAKTYSFQQSITAKIITDIDAAKQDVITGTANQIIKTGTVLSTPQDIATSSAVQHARLGLGQAADATIPLTVLKAAIGATPTDAITSLNTTAAAAGAQQYSGAIHQGGQGWKTNATAATQAVDFRSYVIPVQGAANPSGNWTLESSINGGAYANGLTYDTAGSMALGLSITIGTTGAFQFGVSGRSGIKSSADGLVELFNAARTGFTRLNFGGTTSSFPALKVSSTTLQHRLADDSADGPMSAAAGTFSGTLTSNGDLTLAVAKKLTVASGSNQRAGNTTLVGGTVTVSNTTVTANTIVMLTRKTSGGTIGTAITYTVSSATSFTVNSDNILDTSSFSYLLVEVA